MRRRTAGAGLAIWLATVAAVHAATRETVSFDPGWRFLKSDATGAERPTFDDGGWRAVDVPHDWSIEGPFAADNPTGGAGGFLPAGVGWYRKHFTLPSVDAGRRVFVDFDGVMANSDVWLNGTLLGHRPYGYSSFRYELTDHLTFGEDKPNVLAVRCDDAQQPASRWYAGAGIYRHVRLVVTDPVHLDHWGTFVSTPAIAVDRATVHVRSTVVNQSNAGQSASVRFAVVGPDGREVGSVEAAAQAVAAGKGVVFAGDVSVAAPLLWDLDHPNRYTAVAHVSTGDEESVPFGIRTAAFDPATGFHLNGKPIKINGVCLHADGGAFGAAVPLGVWERRLSLLRPLGVNAIRTAHNPPDPGFLDLCDRMGFLVMDEAFDCWTVGKNRFDYHLYFNDWSKVDARDMVLRDRNHPSVILYSAGNEIHDTPQQGLAKGILRGLVETMHAADPTRPVTQALFRPNVSGDYTDGLADLLDVVGQNYRPAEILAAHEQRPTRSIIGTENTHDRDQWLPVRDHPAYAGEFLWTGIDYLGEAARWPMVGSSSGLLDRTGVPRARAFERQSWWAVAPVVHMVRRTGASNTAPTDPGYEPGGGGGGNFEPGGAGPSSAPMRRRRAPAAAGGNLRLRPQVLFPDWSPANRSPHQERVEVYSNVSTVELLLNGRSLGTQPLPRDASPRTWAVPFEPGTLRAVATDGGGHVVATDELRTAGPAARLRLSVDRPDLGTNWDDVAAVSVEVTDSAGVLVPTAADAVTFTVAGPGTVAAVDNGDVNSHEPFQSTARQAYQGRCVAFVRANGRGDVTVSATAAGLAAGSVVLHGAGEQGR
jgi:beta-galactosidase